MEASKQVASQAGMRKTSSDSSSEEGTRLQTFLMTTMTSLVDLLACNLRVVQKSKVQAAASVVSAVAFLTRMMTSSAEASEVASVAACSNRCRWVEAEALVASNNSPAAAFLAADPGRRVSRLRHTLKMARPLPRLQRQRLIRMGAK